MKVTPETLTDGVVRGHLARLRGGNRQVEYLCRAWLQFGRGAMTDGDVRTLVDVINARASKEVDRG